MKITQLSQAVKNNTDIAAIAQIENCVTPTEFTEVYAWGQDNCGQLGIEGARTTKANVYQIPRSCSFNIVITQVACGDMHSALITKSGHLYTVGSNNMGQLGIGDLPVQPSFSRQSTSSPCLVESLKSHRVEQVSCGRDFTIAILRPNAFDSNGLLNSEYTQVYTWGNNFCGQLG